MIEPSITSKVLTRQEKIIKCPTKCDIGWTSFLFGSTERCLKYIGHSNYPTAVRKCADLNATIPVIRTKEENDQLTAVSNHNLIWLGIERFEKCDKWYETETNFRKWFQS